MKGYACEPCSKIFNFEETARQAYLIIIGKKTSEGPHTDPLTGYGGPDWIEIEIVRVLKGQIEKNKIKVNGWDGMCEYGFILDEEKYVLFLEKKDGSQRGEDFQYDAVNFGCAVKTYLMNANRVVFEGKEIMLEEFIQKLNSVIEG
jgi:hypothetical protein